MQTERTGSKESPIRRYRKVLVVVLTVLIAFTAANALFFGSKPLSKEQVALNRTIGYFANSFNYTLGLMPETPGGNVYWLYSDNYLASLALGRYDPSNQSTVAFGRAIDYVLLSYASTLPPGLAFNQYTALSSTTSSFGCSSNFSLSWSGNGTVPSDKSGALLMTTASVGNSSCSLIAQNYADLLFLEALMAHRLGDNSSALTFYQAAAADFDGTGIKDTPFTTMGSAEFNTYQTYKVALYIYTAVCLVRQGADSNFHVLEPLLLSQQDNSTGGFYTGYYANLQHSSTGGNTETTALSALALELLVNPKSQC